MAYGKELFVNKLALYQNNFAMGMYPQLSQSALQVAVPILLEIIILSRSANFSRDLY